MLFEPFQFAESVLVADDEGDGRVAALNQAVQIQGLAQDVSA